MGEIRFRAYRPEYGMTKSFTLGDLQDQKGFEFTNGGTLEWDEFGLEHEDTKVMQYTGRRDKNKRRIYDCDIVLVGQSNFQVRYNGIHLTYTMYNGVFDEHLSEFNTKDMEVVGNIYENPYLL